MFIPCKKQCIILSVFLVFIGILISVDYYLNKDTSLLSYSSKYTSNCSKIDVKSILYANHIPFDDHDTTKLHFNTSYSKLLIDIGLSRDAPKTQLWLEKDKERIVYGFEPNPFNFNAVVHETITKNIYMINFFPIPLAIGDMCLENAKFYVTDGINTGTSSLNKPKVFNIKQVINTVIIRLDEFLKFIPWNKYKKIDHLKIDTQGHDLKVLKGIGSYLTEYIVCVSPEREAINEYEYSHTEKEITEFLLLKGFILSNESNTDFTWINKKFLSLVDNKTVTCEMQ